jgi:hypothetical protein
MFLLEKTQVCIEVVNYSRIINTKGDIDAD